jgi:hypothetical protein
VQSDEENPASDFFRGAKNLGKLGTPA